MRYSRLEELRINLLPDMSSPRKRPKSLESMKEHSADGMKTDQSRPSEPPLGNDDITLSHILPSQAVTNAKSLSMPELVAAPSSPTSTDRLPHCPTSTPKQKSSDEIGGGLNFKRKKMLALLGQVLSGDVRMVVIAHKDRLARYA